jgi:hypothetical protein
MFRRGVSLLVALGYMAGQLAAVPHAHAEDIDHAHHSAKPHIHFSGIGDDHPHHHHNHQHHHHGQVVSDTDQRAAGLGCDHDGDAVYLQSVVAGGPSVDPSHIDLLPSQLPGSGAPGKVAALPIACVLSFAWRQSRSELTGGHCALFLTLQTLRI